MQKFENNNNNNNKLLSILSALNELSLTHLIASRYCAPFSLRTLFLSYLLDTYNEWKYFLKDYSYFVLLKDCNITTFYIETVNENLRHAKMFK